MTHLKRQKLLC